MLISAAKQHTGLDHSINSARLESSVSLNLLSQQDLMQLKQQSQSESGSQLTQSNKFEKKYIILTFSGEFDKVHYPLPLKYLEEPEMDQMYKTFQRLQCQLQMNRTGGAFTDRNHHQSLQFNDNYEAQSEIVMNRSNAIEDFFKIEQENENLRDQVYEI